MSQLPVTSSEILSVEAQSIPEVAQEDQQETNVRVARATGVLSLGNLAGRVLGLAREVALTNLFGASRAVDAFNVAIIVPKGIYDLLIAGHVNSAIIPVLSEIVTVKGRTELWRVVSILCSMVTVILAVLVLLLEIFAPQIVNLVAGGAGADPQTLTLATSLLRMTAPALIFMSLFAVLSGTLYALRSFTLPAFAGVVFNGSIVVVMLLLTPPLQLHLVMQNGLVQYTLARPEDGITATALGWLVGALAQLLLQMPGLKGARLGFTFNWRHPALMRIARLYAPVMFSLVMDTLIIRPFSYNLAIQTGVGSVSYMNWATTLIQFPQGLVATAISIAILPTLARQAASLRAQEQQTDNFKDTLGLGLRLATTLILPATAGLFALAVPIVALLFEHGVFNVTDTAMTAMALRLYLIGLPFAALDLLLIYAFYARQDTLTPALVGVLSLVVYMVVAIVLLPNYGLFSLMIADSVKHVVHATVSGYLLWRRLRGLGGQRLMLTLSKTLLASLGLMIVAGMAASLLASTFEDHTLIQEIALVAISGSLGSVVFFALAALLRIEELSWLVGMIRQRLQKTK